MTLSNAQVLSQEGAPYNRTAAEIAAGVTPTNYGYLPGDVRRYGGDQTGVVAADTAFASAIATGHRVTSDASCTFLLNASIGLVSNLRMDLGWAKLNFANDTDGFENKTGAGVLHCDVANVILNVTVANTRKALNLVDVSRSCFRNIRIGRAVAAIGWGYGVYLASSASVALWNAFYHIFAECVNTAFIYITGTANENRFYSAQLINTGSGGGDRNIPNGGAAVNLQGGSANRFFGLELESVMTATSDMVLFGAGTGQNTIVGLHTEAYAGSGANRTINWSTSVGNSVIDHYGLGYTAFSTGTITGNTWLNVKAVGNTNNYITTGVGLAIPNHTGGGGQPGAGILSYDSTDDRHYAATSAGGARKVVQSPALDDQDVNSKKLTNVANITLNAVAVSGGAGTVNIGGTTASTVGAAGGASALPATPLGYIIVNVAGTQAKIPYYNN